MLSCRFVRELTEITVAANTDSVVAFTTTLNGNTLTVGQRDRWNQFKIKKVKFTYVPSFNVGATLPTNQDGGSIYTITDKQSPIATMSAQQVMNYPPARRHNFYKPFSVYYTPYINRVVAGVDAFTLADLHSTRGPSPWLGCDIDGGVQHFGHQVLFNHVGPNALKWGVIETLYVQFRTRNGNA